MSAYTPERREKMRLAMLRRIERGEKVGFQKGHVNYNLKTGRNMPKCETCSIELKDYRSTRCRKHVDASFNSVYPGRLTGRHWKLNLNEEQKKRRKEIGESRVMSESARQKVREWHLNNPNRKFKDTGIELLIEEALKARGIPYEKQVSLHGVARVDFFLPGQKIVIQCDGCYWHNCPTHYPEHHKEQSIKDATKDEKLRAEGLVVNRFWEHDINISADECLNKLEL